MVVKFIFRFYLIKKQKEFAKSYFANKIVSKGIENPE